MAFLKNITTGNASDADLLQRYKQSGDLTLLGALYSPYMDLLYGVCLNYLKEPAAAQDAVMNIFEELVTKLQKHEVENFRSWLYTLAKNHCLMRLRAGKRSGTVKLSETVVQSEEDGHLEEVWNKEANLLQLEECMGQLGNEQRQAINLFYLQGKCYNEIAAETGMDWSQVRSHIQNGRRNLKLCMESRAVKTTVK